MRDLQPGHGQLAPLTGGSRSICGVVVVVARNHKQNSCVFPERRVMPGLEVHEYSVRFELDEVVPEEAREWVGTKPVRERRSVVIFKVVNY